MADAPIDSAWVEIVPDFSGFKRSAESTMSSTLGSAGDAAGITGASRFGSSFVGGLGKVAGPVIAAVAALGIAQGIADAIHAGIDLGLDALQKASDLQQSAGAVQAIFGTTATTIETASARAAKSAGLSANAYNELAAVLGAQLKNSGQPLDQIADKTTKLIGLGSDLSAQFGGPTSDAVEAISSALKGERDPIEKYGVSLTQAVIDAKAAELGFKKVGGVLTTQATQAATLALIYDQTASAQGQFAAQSGTLAEQQQTFAASIDNVKTKLGNALLPAATAFASFANDKLIPILDDLVGKIGPVLTKAISDNAPAFKQLIDQLIPLIPQIVDLAVNALPILIQAAVVLIPLITDMTMGLSNGFKVFSMFFQLLNGDISVQQFAKTIDGFGGSFGNAVKSVVDFGKKFGELVFQFETFGKNLIEGFIGGITDAAKNIAKAVTTPIAGAVNAVKKLLGIASPSKVFYGIGAFTAEGFNNGWQENLQGLSVGALNVGGFANGAASAATGTSGPSVQMDVTGVIDPVATAEIVMQNLRARLVNLK